MLSRRRFLVAGAGAAALAACGGGDDDDTSGSSTTATARRTLLTFVPQQGLIEAGSEQRLVFGIGDAEGIPLAAEAPERIRLQFSLGGRVGGTVEAERHIEGVPRAYYPVRATFPQDGTYEARSDRAGSTVTFQVAKAGALPIPGAGDRLQPVLTPTTADPRGVTPICTREPACPLHEVTLQQAIGEDRPIAFLISTPKFCQQKVCGPVLDVLLSQQQKYGDRIRMLHAEVYVNPEASLNQTTESVQAHRLTHEPVLFLASAGGVVTQRVDTLFDEVELEAALERLVTSGPTS